MTRGVSIGRFVAGLLMGLFAALLLAQPAAAAECEFIGRFKAFRDLIPDVVGECTENASLTGFGSEQRTTNGILYWTREDNEVEFTNGLHTWVYGENGLESIDHDEMAQLRGLMARALMKDAVEDYIIEHGMWRYFRYADSSVPVNARIIEFGQSTGYNFSNSVHRILLNELRGSGYGYAVYDRFNWRQAWDRLNPNQEGVHHLTPTWVVEWLDLPYSEQWQIHQVSAEQMLLLQEVWLRRYHPLIVEAYSDTFGDGADTIQELTEKGCLPTTPVVSLVLSDECWYGDRGHYSSFEGSRRFFDRLRDYGYKYLLESYRKSHDYSRLVAMWWVLHGYTGLE